MTHYVESSAAISQCGKYRYRLTRRWGSRSDLYALWVMLNPSTADSETDDPTIRRCVAFSKSWGYHGLMVVNKFAFRATNPKALLVPEDPVGPLNDAWLREAALQCQIIICAWGKPGGTILPSALFPSIADSLGFSFYCLGINLDGSPKHPLYLAASTPLGTWRHYPIGSKH